MRKFVLITEELAVPSPAQQVLDRFLLGYNRDGESHRPDFPVVGLWLPRGGAVDAFLKPRTPFGLRVYQSMQEAIKDATTVVVCGSRSNLAPSPELLGSVLETMEANTQCFVVGALTGNRVEAQRFLDSAKAKKIALRAGTPLAVTWRLPEIDLNAGEALDSALVVVQGPAPMAEFEACEALFPWLERRAGGESGVRQIRYLEGADVWNAGREGLWSTELLAAALSRSDTPQGDPVNDGRTQDLLGQGLVPKLATHPRAWLLQHHDGLRSTFLVLDGVIADVNVALRTRRKRILSAQLFRGQSPQEEHYSRLAASIESFTHGHALWSPDRHLLTSVLLEDFANPQCRVGGWVPV